MALRSSLAVPMNDWLPETLLPESTHLALWHKHAGRDWIATMNVACVFHTGSMRKWRSNRNLSRKTISNQSYFYLSIPFIKILQNCCRIKRQSKSTQPKTTDKNGTGVSGSDLIQTITLFFWILLCFVIFVSF